MKPENTVSIIIPVYNLEDYISECLDSIIDTQCKNCEIIIVNDGSTDNSLAIIEEYEEKIDSIKIIDKSNGGVASARNEGIKNVNGDYIYFLDGDDIAAPKLLETMINFLNDYPGADIYYGSFKTYDENNKEASDLHYNKIKTTVQVSNNPLVFLQKVMEQDPLCVLLSRHLYSRRTIENNKIYFDESLSVGEDFDFFFRYFCIIESVVEIDLPFYYYRSTRPGSLTYSQDAHKVYITFENRKWFYNHFQNLYTETHDDLYIELRNLMARYFMSIIPLIERVDRIERSELYDYVTENMDILRDAPDLRHKVSRFLYKIFGIKNGSYIVNFGFKIRVWLKNL